MFSQVLRIEEVVDGQELCLLGKLLRKKQQIYNIKRSFMLNKFLKLKMKMVHTTQHHINLTILEMKKMRHMKRDRLMIMMRMKKKK